MVIYSGIIIVRKYYDEMVHEHMHNIIPYKVTSVSLSEQLLTKSVST